VKWTKNALASDLFRRGTIAKRKNATPAQIALAWLLAPLQSMRKTRLLRNSILPYVMTAPGKM